MFISRWAFFFLPRWSGEVYARVSRERKVDELMRLYKFSFGMLFTGVNLIRLRFLTFRWNSTRVLVNKWVRFFHLRIWWFGNASCVLCCWRDLFELENNEEICWCELEVKVVENYVVWSTGFCYEFFFF